MCVIDGMSEKEFDGVVERTEGKYIKGKSDEGWEWRAGKYSSGYGSIFLYKVDGKYRHDG